MPPDSERAAHAALRDQRGDEELMLAFCDGEATAFEHLVHRHRRPLFSFLLRSVHNQARAEELLQEVFLRVVRAKDRYQRTAKFTTWVYTIARNLCVDESRRQKFRRTQSLEQKRGGDGHGLSILDRSSAAQPSVDDQAQAPTLRRRMQEAVSLLPAEQREVFLMRQISGMSFKEIGSVVGSPENTVKSRMRYALEKLRNELSDVDPRESVRADPPKKERSNG